MEVDYKIYNEEETKEIIKNINDSLYCKKGNKISNKNVYLYNTSITDFSSIEATVIRGSLNAFNCKNLKSLLGVPDIYCDLNISNCKNLISLKDLKTAELLNINGCDSLIIKTLPDNDILIGDITYSELKTREVRIIYSNSFKGELIGYKALIDDRLCDENFYRYEQNKKYEASPVGCVEKWFSFYLDPESRGLQGNKMKVRKVKASGEMIFYGEYLKASEITFLN